MPVHPPWCFVHTGQQNFAGESDAYPISFDDHSQPLDVCASAVGSDAASAGRMITTVAPHETLVVFSIIDDLFADSVVT